MRLTVNDETAECPDAPCPGTICADVVEVVGENGLKGEAIVHLFCPHADVCRLREGAANDGD